MITGKTTRKHGVLGAASYATTAADDLLLGTVRDVHQAVAGRVGAIGNRVGGPVRIPQKAHDVISGAVYAGLSGGLRAAACGLSNADEAGLGGSLNDSPGGRRVVAVLNGLVGDRLVDEAPHLSVDLAVRRRGEDVPLDHRGVAAAFPQATGDVVVFVHGLIESEEFWDRPSRPRREDQAPARSYGARLVEDGWSPVFLRLNTGLPISENGVALASLLDRLVAVWPCEVRRIALVGHSMGGMISRAACAVSTEGPAPWTDLVTDVVCLGTPHLGAPLERVVNRGSRALGWLPESAPFGRILDYRSVGILNLRGGLAPDVANLPRARYRLVAATLTRSPRHPVAETIGDLLVPYSSALGRARRGPDMFPGASTLHVPGSVHLDLLNHDDVWTALRGWLREPVAGRQDRSA